jgi:hypothetical protein
MNRKPLIRFVWYGGKSSFADKIGDIDVNPDYTFSGVITDPRVRRMLDDDLLLDMGLSAAAAVPEKEPYTALVSHARRELGIMCEDPETTEKYLKVVQAFADMGHSGGSSMIAIAVINILLNQKPLGPLTDHPDDWQFHDENTWGEKGGIWQSRRDGEAFSDDGGKTHFRFRSEHDRGNPIMSDHDNRLEETMEKDPAPCAHCGQTDHATDDCPSQGG